MSYEEFNKIVKLLQIFPQILMVCDEQGPKKGLTDARSAVGFCLGSGLFGSCNSD